MWGAPDSLFGVFGTTWYHKLPLPGVADFVKKWQAANKDGPIPVPGQRLLQRLHGDARIAARDRARRLDQQRQGHQGAREPEDVGDRPHAAFRRLHGSR